MPRLGTISGDIVALLEKHHTDMGIQEIKGRLDEVRRFPVKRHSVRSALYQHLDNCGEQLFVRTSRGRYLLRK